MQCLIFSQLAQVVKGCVGPSPDKTNEMALSLSMARGTWPVAEDEGSLEDVVAFSN